MIWPSWNYFGQTVPIGTNSYSIPGNTLTAGNRLVIVGIASNVVISGAASGSSLTISGINYVPITVTDNLSLGSISVSPTNPTIIKGTSQQFTAMGQYCNGTTQDITTSVTWSSSDNVVASISNAQGSNGKTTDVSTGTATITATLGNISGSTTLAVTRNWTQQAFSSTGPMLCSVAWSGKQFVAVGYGPILTSSDGVTWTPHTSGNPNTLVSVASSGTQYVAVGDNGTVLTSSYGATWTKQTSGTINHLHGVTWSGTQFVAVGDSGTVITSPDGITWTQTSSGAFALGGIAWSGTRFIAVGNTISRSSDGVTWTQTSSGTTNFLRGVAWSGTQFVAVGDSGTVITSPDGVTWTPQTSGSVYINILGVASSGTELVAVGDSGTIITSRDGATWTKSTTGTMYTLTGVAWSGTEFAVVGAYSTILMSQ